MKPKYLVFSALVTVFMLMSIFSYTQAWGQSHMPMMQAQDSSQHTMMKNMTSDKSVPPRTGNNGWIAPVWTDTLTNPIAGDAKMAKAGKNLFDTQCFVCHGPKGLGDGIAGAALNPKPANFTSKLVQQQTDGAIFWKMTTGNGLMASYKSTYTAKQRWELVDYLRELGKK